MIQFNKQLLPIKIHYFLFNAGVVPLLAFGPVFAKQLGLSALTAGIIYTIIPLTSICGKIVLSGIADRYNKRRVIFALSIIFCICCSFLLTLIRADHTGQSVSVLCHNQTFISSCHSNIHPALIDKMKKRDPYSSITCQVKCKNASSLAEEICLRWRGEESCLDGQQEDLQFIAVIMKKHILADDICVHGLLENAILTESSATVYPHCRNDIQMGCTIKCDNTVLMNELRSDESPFLSDLKRFRTWFVLFVFLFFMCGVNLNFSLTDAICFDRLGDKPHLYGMQRWLGALGFGMMTLVCGWLIDLFSHDSFTKNYEPIFTIACAVFALDLFVMARMRIEQKVTSLSVVKDVSVIFYSPRVVVFAFWCFLTGMFCGMCWEFLFWHLEDMSTIEDLEWIRTLQGLANFFNTILGEIPMFFLSGYLIKWLGHINAMSVLLFASAIRFFCYSILARPIWVLPIELLSGFVFSLSYVLLASYSSKIALPGTESTVQAVFGALFDGVGMACGGLFGGMIYNLHNGYVLFSLMSYVSLVAAVLHVMIHLKLGSRTRLVSTGEAKNPSAVYTSPTEAIGICENTTLETR